MMTTTRKSFLLSLMFHTLMGALAFFVLIQMRTPPPMMKIETKHIMILSLADSAPKPKHQEILEIPAQITPPTPLKPQPITPKPITPQPIIPIKAQIPQPTPTQIPVATIPVVSTSPVVQRSVQNAPITEIVQTPPKQKADTASEKKAFLASIRNTIQNNLRYPSAARRRGMEGEVGIRFNLSDSGAIGSISILSGETIFHNAAKAAVSSISGIDIPKNLIDSMPMEINLILEFNLKG